MSRYIHDRWYSTKEYYYRENKDTPLVGPMTWYMADRGARRMSANPNGSGLAEMCTYVGNRSQDPPQEVHLEVIAMYIHGKKTLAGKLAQYHSDNRLPPTK